MTSIAGRREAGTVAAGLVTDEQSAHRIAGLLSETDDAGTIAVTLADAGNGSWRVAIDFRARPDERAVRALVAAAAGPAAAKALRFQIIAAADWIGQSLAGLRPVLAGRFIVHGAHDRGRIPANRIGIEIEAALAFGSGHHGTTRGCLVALDRLAKARSTPRSGARKQARCILDLGTGSGILAIAAARRLRQRVLATDIDANAARIAGANARLNRAGPWIEVVKAAGVTGHSVRRRAPFDLVFANILLRPLQLFAVPLKRICAGNGRLVLSGLLPSQANAALAAYRPLALERRMVFDGWMTLVLARPCRRRRRRASVARERRGP
jgi:ribosomal protein L11 methyltransferase